MKKREVITIVVAVLVVGLLFVALKLSGGGNPKSASENPTAPSEEVKPVEEKQQEVKPEEPVAETKPTEEAPVSPHLKYEITDDAVTITGCDESASGKLEIPATIKGKAVTSIGDLAFSDCRSLTSITIPDSVTSIGSSAFHNCSSLTSITIPDSVTSIGGAFGGCISLTSIEVSAGNVNYTDVNGVLFNKEKTVLNTYSAGKTDTNYTIPDSVTRIGDGAFDGCSSLTSITIPDSVTSIGDWAFAYCFELTSITIPAGVTSIGEGPFYHCPSLTAVTFLGDAPKADKGVFQFAAPTIYRKPEAKGWGETFDGRPVKLISEKP